MSFARVAVPVPLGQAFTYSIPEELREKVRRGARVLCEFGRRKVVGLVLEAGELEEDVAIERIKPIRAVVDAEPALPEELLGFLQELARYYFAPIGEVVELALPKLERSATVHLDQAEVAQASRVLGRLQQVARATEPAEIPALRGRANEIYAHLRGEGPSAVTELTRRWKNARSILRRLAQVGLVSLEQGVIAPRAAALLLERDRPPILTQAQEAAVGQITARLEQRARCGFLLEGVTASGKTEVYLHAVQRTLELGRSALVLVPEIALTPQLVSRFRSRLGDAIAVIHSGINETERLRTWRLLRSGELRVVVGARSALFAPVRDLGLVCVDEEHDGSFKQEEGVRYHARDMALLRAYRSQAVCVLGSATPSLSTVALVEEGKLEHLRLPARARENTRLPEVEIIDLRRVGPGPGGERLLTLPLFRALEQVLRSGEQAILFLNRRGFAPSLVCEECGAIVECPNCSVALTLHRARGARLCCHYCDEGGPLPSRCPECQTGELCQEGAGTERIEAALSSILPSARVARLDRDVASGIKSERVLGRMQRGEIDILVGTQMVTKGHDLPRVTLVGVLNADAALSMPDFRAAERSFHLLVQVAGRAGRGEVPGRVLIQTRQPNHPAIACAVRHDVAGFLEQEMAARKELSYPPFSRLVLVRFDALDESRAQAESERLSGLARRTGGSKVEVLGPAPAPIARLRNRFRYRFLLRSPDRGALRAAVLPIVRSRIDARVRMVVDVDPVNML